MIPDNGKYCQSHPEFEKRLDERWKESWDAQRKINDTIFQKLETFSAKMESNRIDTLQSINDVGKKLAKVLGGIGTLAIVVGPLLYVIFLHIARMLK